MKKENVIRPLGRWRIDSCDKRTNAKIDLSNEDHCGPCGQYIKKKMDEKVITCDKK